MKTLNTFRYLLLVLFIAGIFQAAQSQDTIIRYKKAIIPDYVNFQYAGNVGAYVIGAGYYMNQKKTIEFVLSYGFTTAHKAAKEIHNIAVKAIFIPITWDLKQGWFLSAQTGIGLSRQFPAGTNSFTTLPKTFPEGYYAPNAYRGHLNIGGKIRKEISKESFIKAIDFYAETTTNDQYLMYLFKSNKVGINDIFSLALGLNLILYNR